MLYCMSGIRSGPVAGWRNLQTKQARCNGGAGAAMDCWYPLETRRGERTLREQ